MPDEPRSPTTCARCGAPLTDGPSGARECPRCLISLGSAGDPAPLWVETTGAASSGAGRTLGPPPTLEEVRAALPQLEVVELVGQGGMGSVFRARQRELGRVVALKVLPRSLGEDPAFAERFAREARALARLAHPGIVVVHDFGKSDGMPWLVMEFVEGVNLRALLRDGPIPPGQALAIARELCDALQYAHDEGVVHRDIKPENVLVDARGRVKVADFGLAKLIGPSADGGGDASLTRSDLVMGTPHYMAPEQMERPLEVDHRADLFALGVVLYEMLTGSLPRGTFEPPSQRVRVDVRLDRIVLKALEREPVRRYQQALEIKTDVDGMSSDGAPVAGAPAPTPAPVRNEEKARRRALDEGAETLAHGWRPLVLFALAWVLVAVAFERGPFAFGVALALPIALMGWLVRARVRALPEWLAARTRLSRGERSANGFAFGLGSFACLALVAWGHLAHWDGGVHGWRSAGVEDGAVRERLSAAPWDVLRLAAGDELLDRFAPQDIEPRVVLRSNSSSVEPRPTSATALSLVVAAFALWALVVGATTRVREPRALRGSAWHLGAELGASALGGLFVLWVAGPIVALRSHQVLQGVTSAFTSPLPLERATERLREAFAEHGLAVDVRQELEVVERREGRTLAQVGVLRAESSDPFRRWGLGKSGPVRETPQVWATLVGRVDGPGTRVRLDAGLVDPRRPEHELTLTLLDELEVALGP